MKILTSGYWNTNLGDDLFLKVLSERYPDQDFYIISGKKAFQVFTNLPNVHQVKIPLSIKIKNKILQVTNRDSTKLLADFQMHILKRFSAYCEIGGSLYMLPKRGMGEQYRLRKRIVNCKIPYYVMGSNFGPYFNQQQVEQYRRLFKQLSHISFRDHHSFSLFSTLENTSWAPDIAFNLQADQIPKGNDYILFSIINPENRFNAQVTNHYYDLVNTMIKKFLENGERVVLMSFCEAEGDYATAKRIQANFCHQDVEVYNHTNIAKSLEKIGRAKKIVASRYHSMILGWVLHKPTFVMSYSKKIDNVIADLFPEQPYIDIQALHGQAIDPVFAVNENVSEINKDAEQQFMAFDQFLKRNY